jgi:hypothetical protein
MSSVTSARNWAGQSNSMGFIPPRMDGRSRPGTRASLANAFSSGSGGGAPGTPPSGRLCTAARCKPTRTAARARVPIISASRFSALGRDAGHNLGAPRGPLDRGTFFFNARTKSEGTSEGPPQVGASSFTRANGALYTLHCFTLMWGPLAGRKTSFQACSKRESMHDKHLCTRVLRNSSSRAVTSLCVRWAHIFTQM